MTKRHVLRILAAIGVSSGLAFGSPALPAVAQLSPSTSVEVGDQATLVAKGAGVLVPIEVVCPAGSTGFQSLNVQLTQRVGNRIASGFGGTSDFVCTGAAQTIDVFVTAQGERAFKRGPAVADAQLLVCNEFFMCEVVRDIDDINIVR